MSITVKHDSRCELYRMPGGAMPAGGSVRLRLWASRPFRSVDLRVWTGHEQLIPMRALGAYSDGILYEAELPLPGTPGLCWYCFLLHDGAKDYWYGNAPDNMGGVGRVYDHQPPSYQITVFDPAFMPPRWLREGAMYQIFPDRFFRTDLGADGDIPPESLSEPLTGAGAAEPANDAIEAHSALNSRIRPVEHANWHKRPLLDIAANGDNSARDFFGGTLRGVTAKLDYLRALGVTVLYLNPIFLSPSNHRYNCSDYLTIDPRLGTEADLRELCAQAQARGMRVMLDGVFSHTGDDSLYFNRYGTFAGAGACQGPDSPYYEWYTFRRFPQEYQCWWGFDTLPEVNEDSPSFRRFICGPGEDGVESAQCPEGIVRHYLRMGVSGWRLDVADELPMDFLAALRLAALAERPDAAILGEVWEDASNKEAYGQVRCYFTGDTLDSVMNYPLRDMAIDFMLGRMGAAELARRYSSIVENYPPQALHALMNLMGSHDRPRILNLMAGMDPSMPRDMQAEATVPAYAQGLAERRVTALWRLICAMPGMPCVYYGDEAGACGMGDPFNRGTYPWGRENVRLRDDFAAALHVRAGSDVLMRGDVRLAAAGEDVLIVERRLSGGKDYAGEPCGDGAFIAIVNRSLNAVKVCLDTAMVRGVSSLAAEGDICRVEIPALTTAYFD